VNLLISEFGMAQRMSQEARATFKTVGNGRRQQLPHPRTTSQHLAVEEHATSLLEEARRLRSGGLQTENLISSSPTLQECKFSFPLPILI
jgi:hypothetical protein